MRAIPVSRRLRPRPLPYMLALGALLAAVATSLGAPLASAASTRAQSVAALLPSLAPLPLPTGLPIPLPSPLVTCVPLPPPVGDTCTGAVLQAIPGAVSSPPPGTGSGKGGNDGGGGGGGGLVKNPGGGTGGAPGGGAPGVIGPGIVLPPGVASDTPPPDAFAVLLALGIRGGLSLSADHVWPFLAALQMILLLGIAGVLSGNQLTEAFAAAR